MEPGKDSSIPSEPFDQFNSRLQEAALKATKDSLALPSNLSFHRSLDSQLANDLDAFSSRVLSLTNNLLALASVNGSSGRKRKIKLSSQDDVVDSFQSLVVDSVDQLLERADMCLDEYLGRIKQPAIAINPPKSPQKVRQKKHHPGRLDPALHHAANLPKPQLSFKRKPDNDNHSHYCPTLSHKYNAQVPLGYNYRDSEMETDVEGPISHHPYRYEINHISYPTRMFHFSPPIPPKSFDETPFSWVASSVDFSSMLEKLRKATELAIDLEHHSYRTFGGFLCLMQISTREEDWIIDTLVLREELADLNEVFTDPNIVKVFHGADSDIVWLQQDFNLYIVNLFDTYHASKVLQCPRHALVTLLELSRTMPPDKRYQLADWRIRPLPEEMLVYARSDTHFLLYIYDNLRNALLDRDLSLQPSPQPDSTQSPPAPILISNSHSHNPSHALIKEVLSRSNETALRVYEREIYDAESGLGAGGWDRLLKKWNSAPLLVDGVRRRVFLSMHAWRDRVAREDDESTGYVMPNHYLLRLAERPPTDMAKLISILQPLSPVVRKRATELLDVIKDSINTPNAPVVLPPKVEATQEVQEVDTHVNPSPLWSHDSRVGYTVVSSSSLFGSTLATNVPKQSNAYCTSESSLFGNLKGIASSMPSANLSVGNSSFRDLVAKIHSTLVIAPSAPKILRNIEMKEETPAHPSSTDLPTQSLLPSETQQIEIPFIPASQRLAAAAIVDDSIVVVGQTKKNKRKRVKVSSTSQDADLPGLPENDIEGSLMKTELPEAPPSQPFDFSMVSNILDVPQVDESDPRRLKKKRQKRDKGDVLEFGAFPAPPKAHREVKRGNQSHTFK